MNKTHFVCGAIFSAASALAMSLENVIVRAITPVERAISCFVDSLAKSKAFFNRSSIVNHRLTKRPRSWAKQAPRPSKRVLVKFVVSFLSGFLRHRSYEPPQIILSFPQLFLCRASPAKFIYAFVNELAKPILTSRSNPELISLHLIVYHSPKTLDHTFFSFSIWNDFSR